MINERIKIRTEILRGDEVVAVLTNYQGTEIISEVFDSAAKSIKHTKKWYIKNYGRITSASAGESAKS